MTKINKKLQKSLRASNKKKEDKLLVLSGVLGIPLDGVKAVEVPDRKGFVFVRLKGNTSELIQAYNATVSPVYDLPVLVARQGSVYKIIGRNLDRYTNQWTQAPFLPKHGAQHSFNHELNIGGDIVWVYSQQFMPLLTYPSGTSGGMVLNVSPSIYEWNGRWKYSQITGTPSYEPYLPTITGSARMVLSYIDPTDNSIKLVPGTPFSNTLTGSAQLVDYIPDIPRSVGIPLAAVRLVTGTTVIGWDNIYDVRDFYTVGTSSGTSGGGGASGLGIVGQDEGIYIATGTILNVVGAGATLTASGTVLNLNIPGGGGSSGPAGIMVQDDGVPIGTGTIINVGNNLSASISGTVIRIDSSGGSIISNVGVMAWDEGVPLGTGTVFNFVGANVSATISGTVVNIMVTGSASASAGSLVFLEKHTATGSASLDFVALDDSYNDYMLKITGLIPSSAANSLLVRFATDATPTWDSGNNYRWSRTAFSAGGAGGPAGDGGSPTSILIGPAIGTTTGYSFNSFIRLSNLRTAGIFKSLSSPGENFIDADGVPYGILTMGFWKDNTHKAFGIQLLMSSGNITAGTVTLYGIKDS